MRMPWSKPPSPAPFVPHARPMAAAAIGSAAESDAAEGHGLVEAPFTCTTCGRTDLPEVGDWDPPICQECDAQINFDVECGG
jgi:hypothetical protein